MIAGDDRWYTVCDRISIAVQAELTTPVGRAGVVPGMIAWDDVGCGLLAVTWALLMASDTFPQEKIYADSNCTAAWEVAEIAIQVVRCTPMPDSISTAPTTAALRSAAQLMAKDATQMRRACNTLLCTMKDDLEIVDFMVNRITPQGPQGDGVGSELRVYVALPNSLPRSA